MKQKIFKFLACSVEKNSKGYLDYSREDLKHIIKENGGESLSSISKKTSFVLSGDSMGPSKKEKALSLNIPIIGIDEFLNMIKK